jgi:hypothetical protein
VAEDIFEKLASTDISPFLFSTFASPTANGSKGVPVKSIRVEEFVR